MLTADSAWKPDCLIRCAYAAAEIFGDKGARPPPDCAPPLIGLQQRRDHVRYLSAPSATAWWQ
jgi:hypothetical protein